MAGKTMGGFASSEEARRHIDFIQDSGLGRNIAAEDEPAPRSDTSNPAVLDAERQDWQVEKGVEDTFPASDPLAVTQPAKPPSGEHGRAPGSAPPDIVEEARLGLPRDEDRDDKLDEAVEETFPASDPPALTQPPGEIVGSGRGSKPPR